MGCIQSILHVLEEVTQETQAAPDTSGGPSQGSGGIINYYTSLPASAKKVQVRNVYDGDTLTLIDEQRVRFLGIDTPELKQKQPYAQEAKDYTKTRCPNNSEIYIVSQGQDHYGRILAWVFVEASNGDGYECVNEGLIQNGLAYAYTPANQSKPSNWDKLLELQSQARENNLGVWKNLVDETVFITANGSAYHRRSCSYLSKSRNLTEITISEAADKGRNPCRSCMG